MRSGVADDQMASIAGLTQRSHVRRWQRRRRISPLGGIDTIGNVDKFVSCHAVLTQVRTGLGQHGDHDVGVAAGGVLGPLHPDDEGMPAGHATKLHRRLWPEVMHLPHQRGAMVACNAPCRPDIGRVSGRCDNDIGHKVEPPAPLPQPAQERSNVDDTADAIAPVARGAAPDELDAIHRLTRMIGGHPRLPTADMRLRGTDDRHPMSGSDPLTCKVIAAVLHAVGWSTRVVIDVEDVQAPRSSHRHCTIRWAASP